MTKLGKAFATMEGYYKAGTVPNTHNNPGDLRHAPGETHLPGDPDGIGSFATPEAGEAAEDRQLRLYAGRGYTLAQAVNMWAPTADGNNATAYLTFVCNYMGLSPNTPVSEALEVQA